MNESQPRGIDRLERIFRESREEQRGVLMPFVVGGHPRGKSLGELLAALERGGAGVVEIGFPFSDPIADGGVIAQAMHETLEAGRSIEDLLDDVRAARSRVGLGLVAMVSVSIAHRIGGPGGPGSFMSTLAQAGFDGVILPDLPLEEAAEYQRAAAQEQLGFTLLVAPTCDAERAEAIARASSGFVYLIARTGITGERTNAPNVENRVLQLRKLLQAGRGEHAESPPPLGVAVGFGISTAEHVRAVVASADAAIIGSALVRRLGASSDPIAEAEAFCKSMAEGLRRETNSTE